MIRTLRLREGQVLTDVALELDEARKLHELSIARVEPESMGRWRVAAGAKVGAIRLGELDVRIEPKVPIERLFWMLGHGRHWGTWFDEQVAVDDSVDLLTAIAQAFCDQAERALLGGVLKSYKVRQGVEHTIRGRWLVADQLRKLQGLPLPAELQFDDYTADIAENTLLRSASRRLLGLRGVESTVRGRLQRIERLLSEATLLIPGVARPTVAFDRRNQHYRPGIELAQLVLDGLSLEHGEKSRSTSGYLIDMAVVFEQFIHAQVLRSVSQWGGELRAQETVALDREQLVKMRPDLVWRRSGRALAVFDAKYKAEKPAGYPNADVYQMLAYALRYGLGTGHLIYAAGQEVAARYEVEEAGVTVVCHALRLDVPAAHIEAAVDLIVKEAHFEALAQVV